MCAGFFFFFNLIWHSLKYLKELTTSDNREISHIIFLEGFVLLVGERGEEEVIFFCKCNTCLVLGKILK